MNYKFDSGWPVSIDQANEGFSKLIMKKVAHAQHDSDFTKSLKSRTSEIVNTGEPREIFDTAMDIVASYHKDALLGEQGHHIAKSSYDRFQNQKKTSYFCTAKNMYWVYVENDGENGTEHYAYYPQKGRQMKRVDVRAAARIIAIREDETGSQIFKGSRESSAANESVGSTLMRTLGRACLPPGAGILAALAGIGISTARILIGNHIDDAKKQDNEESVRVYLKKYMPQIRDLYYAISNTFKDSMKKNIDKPAWKYLMIPNEPSISDWRRFRPRTFVAAFCFADAMQDRTFSEEELIKTRSAIRQIMVEFEPKAFEIHPKCTTVSWLITDNIEAYNIQFWPECIVTTRKNYYNYLGPGLEEYIPPILG